MQLILLESKLQTEANGLGTSGISRGGYLKIHVAVDIKRKRILSLHVTSEKVHDRKVLPELVDDITIKQNKMIETAIMDGSYDSNNIFQILSFKGIKPAIKI